MIIPSIVDRLVPGCFCDYMNCFVSGAPHGSELLYLFGPTVYRQEIGVGFSRQDEAVSDLMKRAWLEFASLG